MAVVMAVALVGLVFKVLVANLQTAKQANLMNTGLAAR